ncbi:hypothetical protein BHM03_00046076 [Ensete ventricosum]|uniref:Uncharacterized protein n=1 Tax=Ensete ventricosum TaxID=4639 RepID=A0A426X8Q6_ENSVE|nr:hypothetical protein B296_00035357 [Ensete ventricosum]RZS14382.1 hypothetical protein BHM03_00046076 [Ensete ventricosum]
MFRRRDLECGAPLANGQRKSRSPSPTQALAWFSAGGRKGPRALGRGPEKGRQGGPYKDFSMTERRRDESNGERGFNVCVEERRTLRVQQSPATNHAACWGQRFPSLLRVGNETP